MRTWIATLCLGVAVLTSPLPGWADGGEMNPRDMMRIIEAQNAKIERLMESSENVGDLMLRVKQLEDEQEAVRRNISKGFRRTESLASKLDKAAETEFARWAGKVRWFGDFRYRHEFINDDAETKVVCDAFDGFGNTTVEMADGSLIFVNDYELAEGFVQFDTKLGALPFSVYGDYVVNTVADTDGDTGWLAGFKVGKAKKPGSWQFGYNYRDVEADSIVGAFTDSDFIGGGSSHKLAAAYQVNKCLQFALTCFLTERDVEGDSDEDFKRVQLDIKLKF